MRGPPEAGRLRGNGTARMADGGPAAISRAVVLAPGEYTGGGTATGSPAARARTPPPLPSTGGRTGPQGSSGNKWLCVPGNP